MKKLIKLSLSAIILFSFFTIVKAQEDYQLIIITPAKFATVAQDFLKLHDDNSDWTIRGVYATVEEIVARYDQKPTGVQEPSPAPVPTVPTPTLTGGGFAYPPSYITPVPNLCIIKFLRGILEFVGTGQEYDFVGTSGRRAYQFAFDVLRDENGAPIFIGYEHAKFQYLLLLGETGAAGGASMTYNGVPESWYVYMDPATYGAETGPDGSVFPTDFFYASPNYYTGIDWVPNLIVGRIPVHDLNFVADASDTGFVTEITAITDPLLFTNPPNTYNMDECVVCDSEYATQPGNRWTPGEWADYELWIVSDGNPPAPAGTGQAAPIGATYLILDNSETCLRVLGNPAAAGLEAETPATLTTPLIPGDGYEIHDNGIDEAQDIFDKCAAYDALVKTDPDTAWNDWYRKVVTAGGDSYPYLFSFWDEFVLADITNEGFFEGNELIKLRHTNEDDTVITDRNFEVASFSPYLQDEDCGLLFHLGLKDRYLSALVLDDDYIDIGDVFGYASSDSHMPIMVSNSNFHGRFDFVSSEFENPGPPPYYAYPSFGEMVVESPAGGGIAYIGSTDTSYSGIIPLFDNGVVEQDRLFNMDELLSYTMESFHSAPKYLGDIFAGSPTVLGNSENPGLGPINQFIADNEFTANNHLYWYTEKTVFEYTLLGDPCLPVPYPGTAVIETRTEAPSLTLSSLRTQSPQYESHDIGVDEIPDGGSASTTVNVTPTGTRKDFSKVKITRVDVRRDTGKEYTEDNAAPFSYSFDTPNTEPGYYFVKVEQPGYDNMASNWGTWWEKENWIYVQEVNEFTPTNNILVVDDDFGYPIVTYNEVYGFEDWYLKTLDNVVGAGNYDIWHVDFDDNLFNTAWIPPDNGPGDDWAGVDAGSTLMNGEVYANLLANYSKVIWLTGDPRGYWRPSDFLYPTEDPITLEDVTFWNLETLTSAEQNYLESYLNSSGRLFLSGQGILWDLGCSGLTEPTAANLFCERRNDSAGIQNEFLTGYLYITDLYSSIGRGYHPQLKAVSGNPVISGPYTIVIAGGPTGAQNQYIFVDAEPSADTPIVSRVFEYTSLSGDLADMGDTPFFGTTGTAYYRGQGASVFLPWGFEAINDQTNRNQVMAAILSWLDNPTRTGEGEDEGDGGDGGAGGVGSLNRVCFIATASYGTPMAKEVIVLSHFRDEYLMTNSLGRMFVRNYYKFSPYLAEYISERPILKKLIRIGLKPLVHFSEILVDK